MAYVPNLRFTDFLDEWNKTHLLDIIDEIIKRKNDGNNHPVMMISASVGFINQSEKYSRDNAGTSLENYTLLKKNEFAYNRGNSKVSPFGAIFRLNEESALVPYVYHSFSLNEKVCDYSFYSHYLNSTHKDKQLQNIITSSVRGNGLLNISSKDFFNIIVSCPNLNEQKKIGCFLDLINKRIDVQNKIIEDLKIQKKSIIDMLLNEIDSNSTISLSSVLNEVVCKTETSGMYPVLSSTANGIFLQSEYFNKEAASEDTTGYKIVPKGYCTYRSMSDTGKFNFNQQNIIDKGIVSPAYPVFYSKSYDVAFVILYLNHSKKIKKQILELKTGGTRFALSFKTLCTLQIPEISLSKQREIMQIIQIFDKKLLNEISIHQKYLQQKQYLLNNMFI